MIAGINPSADIGFPSVGERGNHTEEGMDAELDFEADLRAQDAWRESQLMQETGGLGSMAKGIMRPGGRHTIVCKHWLRDLCMKGDKCDFLHQYDLARMPECTQWSRMGRCIDQECDFRHDTERMECQKFKFGFCKMGSQCKMRHERHMRSYLPEIIPDWYLKELVPNIFEFVPKLPEETVRITNLDEQLFGPHPPFPIAQQEAGSWNVGQEGGLPAVAHDAWAVPVAPQWSAQAFRDVQPAHREKRRADAPQRATRDDRRSGPRRAPVTELKDSSASRPQSPGREFNRPFPQDRHRTEDRKVDSRREEKKPSPVIQDRQRERRDEPRREERRMSSPADRRENRRHSPTNDRERRSDRRNSPPRASGRPRESGHVDRQPSTRGSSPSSRRTEHRDRRDDQRDDRRRHRSRSRSNDRRRNDRHRENRR